MERKGITNDQQKDFKAAREMVNGLQKGDAES